MDPTINKQLMQTHILRNTTHHKHSNAIFTPLSIHVVLGYITVGSSAETLDHLLSFHKVKSRNDLKS